MPTATAEKPETKRRSPKITASDPLQWIDDMFKNYKRDPIAGMYSTAWPFDFLVVVSGRADSPSPRHSRWEYILDHGMPKIEKVLNLEPIGPGPHYFIFPDRWLNPAEAQMFGSLLCKNPDAKKFGRVYVVTNQPYIVSDCRKEQVLILTEPDMPIPKGMRGSGATGT